MLSTANNKLGGDDKNLIFKKNESKNATANGEIL